MNPLHDLVRTVTMPLRALFVVGLCGLINAMTYSGAWWFKWVALGMGIATVLAWARGLRALVALALLAAAGWWIYRRHGATARRAFDDWAVRAQPAAADVLRRVGEGLSATP